jgi:hypothetical protein
MKLARLSTLPLSLSLLLALGACGTTPAIQSTSLAGSSWAISGVDEAGNDWRGSTLYVHSDFTDGQGVRTMQGHFCWTTRVAQGKEVFQGGVSPHGELQWTGVALPAPSRNLAAGVYRAQLRDPQLLQGRWLGDNHRVVPGTWSAQRVPRDFSRCAWE